MKKIHLLVIKSYLGPFVMTFFIALFILMMQFLWKYIDDLVGKGLEWTIIAQLLFYASATFVPLALPLSILLSSLMTFGNLGERYELVAMKAAGVSLRKIMQPLIFTSVLICMAAFYFSNYVLPIANLKMGSLLYDVREKKPALNIKQGIYYDGIDNYIIKVGKKDDEVIQDIMIYDHTSRMGNVNMTVADSGKMEITSDKKYLIFTLYDGCNYYEDIKDREGRRVDSYPLQRTAFKEEYRRFDLSAFSFTRTNEEFFKDNYQMLNLRQLQESEDSLVADLNNKIEEFALSMTNYLSSYSRIDTNKFVLNDTTPVLKSDFLSNFNKEEKNKIIERAVILARNSKNNIEFNAERHDINQRLINKHKIEWHRKFTLSFACLLLFFIGAPLGAIIRKGGLGLPLVISVLFFVAFHTLSITGEKISREGYVDPYKGMWLATAFLLPIGIFLTVKATSDSPLLDTESWSRFFNKFFKRGK